MPEQLSENDFMPRTVIQELGKSWKPRGEHRQMQLELEDPNQTEFLDFLKAAREEAGSTLSISHQLVD